MVTSMVAKQRREFSGKIIQFFNSCEFFPLNFQP